MDTGFELAGGKNGAPKPVENDTRCRLRPVCLNGLLKKIQLQLASFHDFQEPKNVGR